MQDNKLTKLFKNIKLLILDVDGVLTRGEMIYDDKGREIKIFNVKDGLGVSLLGKAGIQTILLTAKESKAVRRRAQDMGVSEVISGILPKEKALRGILERYHVHYKEICFIGDDLLDAGVMKLVGLPITVKDASAQIKKTARYITSKRGGEGAVREVVDLIVKAQKLESKIYSVIRNLCK
jgi:3-deoxy-D-manno-octulosonate 8-phosphate phosphatase (KDO 8-P phosphatase)